MTVLLTFNRLGKASSGHRQGLAAFYVSHSRDDHPRGPRSKLSGVHSPWTSAKKSLEELSSPDPSIANDDVPPAARVVVMASVRFGSIPGLRYTNMLALCCE